jgi:E3 ubiquitin-protein ligase RNF1/2
MPITGGGHDDDDDDDVDSAPHPPPKKKKKLVRPPTALTSGAASDGATSDGASGSAAQEVEIVFKLHPNMFTSPDSKELAEIIKENSTRYIKTTSKALVEHLCKYLAMRISLDLPPSSQPKDAAAAAASSSTNPKLSAVKDLQIFIASSPGQMIDLDGSVSLTHVNEKYWKVNKPMEMFYSFQRA